MAASLKKQLKVSLWKWWLIRRRQPLLFLSELLWPCVLLLVLVLIHSMTRPGAHSNCYFHARANPSAGMFQFAHSMLCNINNHCYNESWHEEIPSFPGSKLQEIATLGAPIFENENLTQSINALPPGLKLVRAAAKVYNDSEVLQQVIEDDLHIHEIFMQPEKILDFLANEGGMKLEEATDFLNSTLKIAQLFLSMNNLELKAITCNPEKLATFIISDNTEAIQSLSAKLCHMSSNQIETFVRTVHQNLDIDGLVQRGLEVVNRTFSYDYSSVSSDLGSFSSTFWSMPALQGIEPPPISQVDLWSDDLGLFLESALTTNDINFHILDTWSNLTLAQYLDPVEYDNLMDGVSKAAGIVHDWLQVWINGGTTRPKREAQGNLSAWSALADEIENLIRFFLEAKTVTHCVGETVMEEANICGQSCNELFQENCSISKVEELLGEFLNQSKLISCILDGFLSDNQNDWTLLSLNKTTSLSSLKSLISNGFKAALFGIPNVCQVANASLQTGNISHAINDTLCSLINQPESLLPMSWQPQNIFSCNQQNITISKLKSRAFKFTQYLGQFRMDDLFSMGEYMLDEVIFALDQAHSANGPRLRAISPSWCKNCPLELVYNVSTSLVKLYTNETISKLEQISEVFQWPNSTFDVIIPWDVMLQNAPNFSALIKSTLTSLPSVFNSWSSSIKSGNWTKVIRGFQMMINSSWPCNGTMSDFWSNTSMGSITMEYLLCHPLILQEELNNNPLIKETLNRIHNYTDASSLNESRHNFITIGAQIADLIDQSNYKESVSMELLNETLISSFHQLLDQLITFLNDKWKDPYLAKNDPFNKIDDLDRILQCWRPHQQEGVNNSICSFQGSISRLGKFLASILRDLEDEGLLFHGVSEENRSALMTLISTHMPVIKNFSDAFVADDVLHALLENAGLSEEIIATIFDGYVNINRLLFQNMTVSERIMSEKKEYERLLKFDDLLSTNAVGRAMKKANQSFVIGALNQAIDTRAIELNKTTWQQEEFLNFAWLEGLSKMVQVLINDAVKMTEGATQIIQALQDEQSNAELTQELLKLISSGTIGSILDGMFEMFDTIEIIMGNDPAAENVRHLLDGLKKLELIDILTLLQFESPVTKLFNDWAPVRQFLTADLGLSEIHADAIKNAEVNIPKIMNGNGNTFNAISVIPSIICSPENMSQYINLTHNGLNHLNVTMEGISSKLCEMTKSYATLLDLSKVVLEELDLGTFFSLALTVDDVLFLSNMTRAEAKNTIKILMGGQKIVEALENNITSLYDVITASFANYDGPLNNQMGVFLCGDEKAFQFDIPANAFLPTNQDDDDENDESANVRPPEPFKSSCELLKEKLSESKEGKLIWRMMAPFLIGNVVYSPNDQFTKDIIAQANQSAEATGKFMHQAKSFLGLGPVGLTLISMERELLLVQDVLRKPVVHEIVNETYPGVNNLTSIDTTELIKALKNASKILDAMKWTSKGVDCYKIDRFISAENEPDLVQKAKTLNDNSSFFAGLVFLHENGTYPKHVQYKIRMGKDSVPLTNSLKSQFWVPGPDGGFISDLKYVRGFLQLQDLIDRAILRWTQKQSTSLQQPNLDEIGVYTQQFPYPCFVRDNFLSSLYVTQALTMMVVFGMAFAMASAIRQQVWEKESQNIQMLEVMGLSLTMNWTVWIIMTLLMLFIISGLLTVLMVFADLLKFSNPILVLFLLFCGSVATLAFAFMMAAAMSRAVVGSVVSILIYIVSFAPFMAIFAFEDSVALWQKLLADVLMTTSLSFGLNYVTKYEQQSIGVNWDNRWKSPVENDPLNLSYCCLILLFDALLYAFVAIFILLVQNRKKATKKGFGSERNALEEAHIEYLKAGVSLQNLTKVFPVTGKESRVAVNNLSLDFQVGDVTSLLGHNGAGKSTMIKMLTGLVEPTSGLALVHRFDTWTQWGVVQSLIGLCPQQSILYDTLTPREHLGLYAMLKSAMTPLEQKKDVETFLESMKMTHLADVPIASLSEGMRRRICVALAFIGGSKVVILDEPTSGVDPIARRHIWELITQFKEGRTIIFTTHHLDEAELLSDKVAIIHKGSLLTYGTLSDIKSHYGATGFELTINHKANRQQDDYEIIQYIEKTVPNAERLPRRHKKDHSLRFLLPLHDLTIDDSETNELEVLFAILENESDSLGIDNYMLECTTLEQIFLDMEREASSPAAQKLLAKVGLKDRKLLRPPPRIENDAVSEQSDLSETYSATSSSAGSHQERSLIREEILTGWSLTWLQCRGLLKKRFFHNLRDWRFFISIFFMPAALIVLSMLLGLLKPGDSYAPLLMTPSIYGPFSHSFVKFNSENPVSHSILETLTDPPGIGTSCMKNLKNISTHVFCQSSNQESFEVDYAGPGAMSKTCACSAYHWTCEKQSNSSVKKPARLITNTTDVLFDLTSLGDINEWILQTHVDFIGGRYGGWSQASDYKTQNSSWLDGSRTKMIVWYNNKAFHALPSYVNTIHNAMLRSIVDADHRQDFGISTFSHPLNLSVGQVDIGSLMQILSNYGVSLMVLVSMAFLPSGFISYLIGERKREEKQVQLVTGVSTMTYWTAAAIWDIFVIMLFLLICALIFALFGLSTYTAHENLPSVLILLFAYCLTSTASVYLVEKAFSEPSMGQLVVLCTTTLVGLLTLIITLILQLLWWIPEAQKVRAILNRVFLVLPPYALGGGLLALTTNQVTSEVMSEYGVESYEHPLSWDILGINICVMLTEAILFFILNLMVEYKWFDILHKSLGMPSATSKIFPNEEDEDVTAERVRIENESDEQSADILRIRSLTKIFRKNVGKSCVAVDNITLGVKSGECFGWLGLNGAGKSTAFKLLTGQMEATSGTFSFGNLAGQALRMGYCPQMDALDRLLTVRETLDVYSKLRGIPPMLSHKVVAKAMQDFDLEGHAENQCGDLSGGTKRKLCSAIAMIGSPHLILMDEPTSGMDAVTKRLVWRRIQKQITMGDSAVVLTSHSMEECEFLCTRLAIMSNGRFKCLGSPDHIKAKYGNGYSVSLFFESQEDVDGGMHFIASRFPLSTHVVRHNSTIQFRVSSDPPSVIFGHILANKLSLRIQDFAVKHTTLDEVFVNFADGSCQPKKSSDLPQRLAEVSFLNDFPESPPGSINLYGKSPNNLVVDNVCVDSTHL